MHTSTLHVCYTHKRFSSAAVFSLSLRELCSDEVREVSVEPQEMDLIGVRTISPRPTLLAVSRGGGWEGRRGRKEGEGGRERRRRRREEGKKGGKRGRQREESRKEGEGRRGSDGGEQRRKRKGGGKEGGEEGREEGSRP